jgi:hypothetical protein
MWPLFRGAWSEDHSIRSGALFLRRAPLNSRRWFVRLAFRSSCGSLANRENSGLVAELDRNPAHTNQTDSQRPVAIGCMRLSTAPDRDDERSMQVLHAALDAGVTLLDTANAYCFDASETGHNERLIARALAGWRGDRSSIGVATKGGLTRPDDGGRRMGAHGR